MGSPTIFSGRYTKLLTNKGILNSDGSLNQNDGPINYVKYAEFEQNVTTGWSLGTTGTLTNAIPTGTPTFGSGASGNLSIATSNVSPIRDNFSLRYVSSAATTAGNMLATDAMTIDAADQAKVLTYKFYYSVVSGASNGNFSGTSSNSFGVAIWDVTNSAWIGVAGNFSMTQNSGVGIASGTFQTNSNTSQIRLVIYNANASAGAITLAFDDFFVGPQTAPIGPVVTDWVSYTPTGSWTTNTTYTGQWRRVGSDIEIDVNIALSGAPTATPLTISIPSGLSIDTTKISGNIYSIYGQGQGINAGSGYYFQVGNITSSSFGVLYQSTTSAAQSVVTATAPVTWVNGNSVHMRCRLPIVGWSSNVQLSNDTDTRVVAFQSYAQPTATLSGSASLVRFTSFSSDTHAAFNTSTGFYTVPVSGYYKVSSGLNISGTFSSNQYLTLYLAKNGSGFISNWVPTAIGQTATQVSATGTVYCNAGDTIAPYAQTNIGSPSVTTSFAGSNYLTIERLSGPSVVAASETVAASYSSSAGQSIPNSTQTVIVFGTKTYDTHGIYNSVSGVGTIPISGKFRITAHILYNSVSWGAGSTASLFINKNGSIASALRRAEEIPTAVSRYLDLGGSSTLQFNAGDTFTILTDHNRGSATSLFTDPVQVYFSIERVGN